MKLKDFPFFFAWSNFLNSLFYNSSSQLLRLCWASIPPPQLSFFFFFLRNHRITVYRAEKNFSTATLKQFSDYEQPKLVFWPSKQAIKTQRS